MKTIEHDGALVPSGVLDVSEAESLHQVMLRYLTASAEPAIDLSQVEGCDVAGAQVLYAASRSAAAAGKKMSFRGASPLFNEAWARLGLSLDFFK